MEMWETAPAGSTKKTTEPSYFLAIERAFGAEYNALVKQRARHFIDGLAETDEDDWSGALLEMMGRRFPVEAKEIYREFVESRSTHRRRTVINALWNSALAAELLPPLLDDTRPLHYTDGARVCDRAAQAISNNQQEISFNSETSRRSRDDQIHKIKLHCLGIGVRKTRSDKALDAK